MREWLNAQAAGGYVTYHADSARYSLTPEQAFALANEDSPAYLPGAFQLATSALKSEPKITEAFRTGAGFGWHEHDHGLFEGTERFFRPNYVGNLVSSWIPALTGVEEKLRRGARVADVGCGHGASTILLAQAYPKSTFVGFDYHGPSVEAARKAAQRAGVADRVTFEQAPAKVVPRARLRPRRVLRLPARHGRSGGGGHPRAAVAGRGRDLDARGAVRERQGGGQPQPRRPRLLLRPPR